MLPLYLLTNAKGQQMRIELKSGEVIEGELTNVDNWMNLTLINVKQFKNSMVNVNNNVDSVDRTDADFHTTSSSNKDQSVKEELEIVELKEVYLKGIYIKFIKLQDDIIDTLRQQISNNQNNQNNQNKDNRRGYNRDNKNYNRRNYQNQNQGNKDNRRNYNSRSSYSQKQTNNYITPQNQTNYSNHNHDHNNNQINSNQIDVNSNINNLSSMGGYVQYHGENKQHNSNMNQNINPISIPIQNTTIEF